jgi:hypothetical protein
MANGKKSIKEKPASKAVWMVNEGLPELPISSRQKHTTYHSRDEADEERPRIKWTPLERILKALEVPKE